MAQVIGRIFVAKPAVHRATYTNYSCCRSTRVAHRSQYIYIFCFKGVWLHYNSCVRYDTSLNTANITCNKRSSRAGGRAGVLRRRLPYLRFYLFVGTCPARTTPRNVLATILHSADSARITRQHYYSLREARSGIGEKYGSSRKHNILPEHSENLAAKPCARTRHKTGTRMMIVLHVRNTQVQRN